MSPRQRHGRLTIFQAAAVDDTRLGNAAFRVLAALGTYSDEQGWCYPSLTTLAKRLNITKQAVSKSLNQLQECGYLIIKPQHDKDGGQRVNLYRLVLDYEGVPRQPDVDPRQPDVDPPSTPGVPPRQPITLTPRQPDVDQNVSILTTQLERPSKNGGTRARRAPNATPIPEDFAISEEMRAWAREKVPALNIDHVHEQFCFFWQSNMREKVNWVAAWRLWMLKEVDQLPAARRRGNAPDPHRRRGVDEFVDMLRTGGRNAT